MREYVYPSPAGPRPMVVATVSLPRGCANMTFSLCAHWCETTVLHSMKSTKPGHASSLSTRHPTPADRENQRGGADVGDILVQTMPFAQPCNKQRGSSVLLLRPIFCTADTAKCSDALISEHVLGSILTVDIQKAVSSLRGLPSMR